MRKPVVAIDGQKITAPGPALIKQNAYFRKTGAQESPADGSLQAGLHKRHGLQGPIDDAFLDSFLFALAHWDAWRSGW